MARQRKPKPKAVILPPEYDDIDEDTGSVMPDDDGWVTLEGSNGSVAESVQNPVAGTIVNSDELVRRTAAKRKRCPPRNS